MTAPGVAHPARTRRLLLVLFVPLVVYLVLCLAGITTSSIGIGLLRQDPAAPIGVQVGESQAIRSDEYGTESPLWLGQIARSGAKAVTPLSVSDDFFAQLPDGPVSSIVFFDGSLLALSPIVPAQVLFAMKWWLPTLLLAIALPLWFLAVGARLRWGYLAAALIVLSPASAWWSGRPVNTLGFVAAGCVAAIAGVRWLAARDGGHRAGGVAAIVLSGVLLARTPTYYQPLAIIVGLPLVVATGVFLLLRTVDQPKRWWGIGLVVIAGGAFTSALFWENRDAVAVGLSTVYPGDRKSTGSAMSVGEVFGATDLGWLRTATLSGTNQSELASSFTVLLAALVVLMVARTWRGGRTSGAVFLVILMSAVFWFSWATIDWGRLGELLPLANRVPPTRAAESAGFLATIAFCLFMTQWRPSRPWKQPVVAAAVAGAISAYAGSALSLGLMPGLTTGMIWVSAVLTSLVVFVLVRWPGRWFSPTLAGVAALALVAGAAPVLVGLGDLRESDTAQRFLSWGDRAREEGWVWASDSPFVDTLMTATGTPALTTRQQIGPDDSAWERLDPGGLHEDLWNRGGLHISFQWTDEPELVFSQPYTDTVVVTGSACVFAQRMPELRYVVSSTPRMDACLTKTASFTWSGSEFGVYRVLP